MYKKNEFKEDITSDTLAEKGGNEVGKCQKKKDELSKERKRANVERGRKNE